MKKYVININNSETSIEAWLYGNEVRFSDKDVEKFDYKFLTDELLLVRLDNKNYLFKSDEKIESEIKHTEFNIEHDSRYYYTTCKNEMELLTEKFAKNRGTVKIKNELLSPMPGAIVKINVKEGDVVKKGQVLVVLEAMKMENELKAAGDCKLQKIFVEEKESVDKNHLLIKFEV